MGVVDLECEFLPTKEARAGIDWYLLPEYWKHGYASEAAQALINYGFNTLELNKITSGCLAENTASEHVMKRIGMTKEARFRKHANFKGKWIDRVEYAILRDDYIK